MNDELPIEAELSGPLLPSEGPRLIGPSGQSVAVSQVTPAQAKIEAVAALTHSAYQKAGQLQLTQDEVAKLQADFPDDAFRPGASGKEELIYIEHAYLRERLNQVVGPGQWAIVPRSRWAEDYEYYNSKTKAREQATRVYVEAMLVMRGCFAAEAIGDMTYYKQNQSTNYGDAVEGAKSAALRRCAKELGIGLQAWKKDWCEGWWKRRNNVTRPQNAPSASNIANPSDLSAQKAQRGAQTQSAPKTASAAQMGPKEQKEHLERMEAWLAKCKEALLKKLEPVMAGATEYAVKAGMILPNEIFEEATIGKLFPSLDWQKTPDQNKAAVTKDFNALIAAIQKFMDGEPLSEPEDQIPGAEVLPTKPPHETEWFMDIIVPVPRKGMKRGEYLKHPDTIRSLYDQRHGTDEDAQLARERLFGFLHHFEPKGWKKRDGTEMPPSESDHKFREALNALGDWLEKKGEEL